MQLRRLQLLPLQQPGVRGARVRGWRGAFGEAPWRGTGKEGHEEAQIQVEPIKAPRLSRLDIALLSGSSDPHHLSAPPVHPLWAKLVQDQQCAVLEVDRQIGRRGGARLRRNQVRTVLRK
ncbi:hypothetical protein E2C01_077236 [Portunus trituberculatus]|uniref:Uncharacterized protein n=1 Tax=Portunus trituberculatus TaxID=210409 RepID=A0A5B7IJT7_PORTR|nr:hypothetical protein [Portunus trituberculatus]